MKQVKLDMKFSLDENIDKNELMKLKIWVCREGENAHGFPILNSALDKARPTLVGKPIVAKYDWRKDDVVGHESTEVPIGCVLTEDDVYFDKDEEGNRWICCNAIVWTRYARDVSFVLERDKIKNVSMEMMADMNENEEIIDFYFVGVTIISTEPAIPMARAEVMEFSALSDRIKELYFDNASQEITNFPKIGDNKKISLTNSNYQQFDHKYAMDLKEKYPQIWKYGGNIRGDEAFEFWHKVVNGEMSNSISDWIKEREVWCARHTADYLINGIIANIKWGNVIKKGESYMKKIVDDEKYKIDSKNKKFSVEDKLGKSESIKIDNSKDSAIMGDTWNGQDADFLNKLLEASNHDSLIKEAYGIVDGNSSKDLSVNDVHYEHHSLKNNILIVNRKGVVSAFQRASQQHLSGDIMTHLKRHYKELGLDTDNFEMKGGKTMKDDMIEKKPEIEMSANEYVDGTAQAGTLETEAEDNKAKSKEFLSKMENNKELEGLGMGDDSSVMKHESHTDEGECDEEDSMDYAKMYEHMKMKYDDMMTDYEKQKKEHTIMMSEMNDLKKFKIDYEEMQRKMEVEKTMNYISEKSEMPEDMKCEMKKEGEACKYSEIDAWSNKVKARAFEFAKPIKNANKEQNYVRFSLPTVPNAEKSNNVWDRI